MERIRGRAASGGIAFGRLVFFQREEETVKKHRVVNPQIELERYEYAKKMALEEIDGLYNREIEHIGKDHADIFLIHKMLVEDEDFVEMIQDIILNESCNADYAVHLAANQMASLLGRIEDDYMRARTLDIKDVSRRLIRHIQNKSEQSMKFDKRTILCSMDIEPSETTRLDKSCVKAICTCYGTVNSHSSILSRSMNIPSVASLGKALTEEYNGCEAVVDGYSGILYIEPDEETIRRMIKKREEEGRKHELLKRLRGRRNVTLDGIEIGVYANISGLMDMKYVEENDAGGIGLLRSEFLYLQNDDYPDEKLQFYTYRRVLEKMNGKRVIVRTLDLGVDKNPDFYDVGEQQNPAMGMRSIRICFERPDVFKTQLRALYRASVYGNLAILFPMIVDPDEIRKIKTITKEVCNELDSEGIPYSHSVEHGIMIETPASVMLSDELAREVDFFNVGTNDLEQYTLAVDRHDPRLEKYCRPDHIAILRMIKIAADSAHRYGKWIGVCGEIGGELSLTEAFLAMGIDMLSVSPTNILPLRRKIRSLDLSDKTAALKRHGVLRDIDIDEVDKNSSENRLKKHS